MFYGNSRTEQVPPPAPMICPDCGKRLHYKRDGIFRWRYCPSCKWDVFKQAPA